MPTHVCMCVPVCVDVTGGICMAEALESMLYICAHVTLCRFTQLVLIFDLGAAVAVVVVVVITLAYFAVCCLWFLGRSALNWAGRARAANGTYCRWSSRPTAMIRTTLIIRRS